MCDTHKAINVGGNRGSATDEPQEVDELYRRKSGVGEKRNHREDNILAEICLCCSYVVHFSSGGAESQLGRVDVLTYPEWLYPGA